VNKGSLPKRVIDENLYINKMSLIFSRICSSSKASRDDIQSFKMI
jgi:hypothetical protein